MKLLIVDDEQQIRTGLAQGIHWAAQGIQTVLTAENGLDALALCRTEKPEIVITDIRMPGLDGLELSRQLVQLYAPVKIIVLSGYSEFAYAQASLKIGVVDYLLKPVNIDELTRKVAECRILLEQQSRQQQIFHQHTQREQQAALQAALARGSVLQPKEIALLEECSGMACKELCAVTIVSVDDVPDAPRSTVLPLLQAAAAQLKPERIEVLFTEEAALVLLCPAFFFQRTQERLQAWQKHLNESLTAQCHTSVSLALGGTGALTTAGFSYAQCAAVLHHRLYQGAGSFLVWDTLKNTTGFGGHLHLPRQHLLQDIASLRSDLVCATVAHLFALYRHEEITAPEPLRAVYYEVKALLLAQMEERGLTCNAQSEELPEFVTLDFCCEKTLLMCRRMMEHADKFAQTPCSREVMQAAEYVMRRYAEDISLAEISRLVGRSQSYFSSLFKREMGVSFIDYISQVRVNEARTLLQTTDALTYEISSRVGFSDYKYFHKVFKKVTGHSPSHYRKKG